MTKFGILIVEGPHDTKFVRRVLKPMGMNAIRMLDNLDDFYKPKMIPDYPPNGDIEVRVPIPAFFNGQDHCLAVQEAGGDSQLVQQLKNLAKVYDLDDFAGIGVLLDNDLDQSVEERFQTIVSGFAEVGLSVTGTAGTITHGEPNRGVFVLPDNQSDGALEDIMLDIAQSTYPGLLKTARTHVDTALQDPTLKMRDKANIVKADGGIKESGRKKAIIGTIASVLSPGRSVSSSIHDNRWFRGENLNRTDVQAVRKFLMELFDLESN